MESTIKVLVNAILPVICWLFCAITSSKLAYKKNRDTQTWFILGLFFGIIALAIIYFLKPLKIIRNIQKKSNQSLANHFSILKPLKIIRNIQKKSNQSLANHFSILKTDNNYWYYLDNEKNQIGPMSLKKLYDIYLKEKISNYTYVWNDSMDTWKKLIDISSLSKLLKNSTN
ncbi:MAG: hypothetical protein K1060chlam1_00079 [Candidatus Anoxychlamydiales bacterium]|nr:hypothetical protein [Candidatus Anoxychlamydiales bacterium]